LKSLYVGNLSFRITNEDLHAAFSEYGQVGRTQIVIDRDTGQSRGFAFFEMVVDAEAQKAMDALNGADFDGRAMTVNEARPREPRSGGFGNSAAARFGSGGRPGGGRSKREPRW